MSRLVLDLGKSACRARIEGTSTTWQWEGLPADKAGAPGASALLADSILDGLAAGKVLGAETVVVGSTFLPASQTLPGVARRLRTAYPGVGVALVDDGLLAHAGALGRAGVVGSVGTGVAVRFVDEAGGTRRVDGWGPDAGDRGGAVDIGRRGLAAACAALDGAGPPTTLLDAVAAELDRPINLETVTWMLALPHRILRLAELAPVICAAARSGDEVAAKILEEAAADVARSCAAALRQDRHLPVAVVGRLGLAEPFAAMVAAALARLGLSQVPPCGGPLDAGWETVTSPPYAGATCLIVPPDEVTEGNRVATT